MKLNTILSVVLTLFTPALVLAQNSTQNTTSSYSTFVYTSTDSSTAGNTLIYSMNAVESTGDIYFHLQAPASGSWVAIGFGNQMAGTLMMVAYPSSNTSGITISPRIASGHSEPVYTKDITVQKAFPFNNSNSIDNNLNIMYVDGVCKNCIKWNGGAIDLTNKNAPFIFAVGPGLDMDDDSQDAPMQRHVFYGAFNMDMTAATSKTNGSIPNPSGGYQTKSASAATSTHKDSGLGAPAHAGLMLFAWLIIFPLGSVVLRILNKVILHAIIQGIGFVFVLLGFGVGIYIGGQYNRSKSFSSGHQILGLFLVLGMLVQLGLGIVGHRIFKKTQVPSKLAKIHVILGSVIILLAVVNGGLGWQLAGTTFMYKRYALMVVAIVIVFIPLRVVAHICVRRRKARESDARVNALTEDGQYQYGQNQVPKEPYTQAVPLQTYNSSESVPQYGHGQPQYR